jgi:hypothetical protein
MSRTCRNPECRNGLTPGVIGTGKGKSSAPLISNGRMAPLPMRWAWIRCSVCNPMAKDLPFKFVSRSDEEMEQRAAWASQRLEYKPQPAVVNRLGSLKANGAAVVPSGPNNSELMKDLTKQMTELISGQRELLDQIKELRAENKELKEENKQLRSGVNEKVAVASKPS